MREDDKIKNSPRIQHESECEDALRYRVLFDQSPDGVLILDTDGKIIEFNEQAHRQLGYTREEFAKLSIRDIEASETAEQIDESIKNVLNKGKAEFEVSHRTKSGEIRNVLVITRTLTLEERTVFHTVWRDITEQKRAEDKLRNSEEKYRDLFENAVDPIFIVDAELNYIDVNKRAVEIFGYSKEEFLTMNILDLIPPEQAVRSAKEFEKLQERGSYEKFEGRMRKKDGTFLDIEVSSSAIYEEGRIIGSRDIVRDISGRKRSEEALHHAYEEMEVRVRERTRELADSNRELRIEIEERRRAEARLRNSKELSDKLNSINTVIHSTLDFETIMQSVAAEAASALGVDASAIGLFEGDLFVMKHVYNLPKLRAGQPAASRLLKGVRYAASVKDAVAFNDAPLDERLDLEFVRRLGVYSMMIAPLIGKDKILGAISLFSLSAPVAFGEVHIDFIRKLSASLSLALENALLYDDRTRIEEHLRHMAHHDSLTGLPNRRFFMDILNLQIAEARRNRKKLGVVFLDLDRFKQVNDTLGHDAGDELLKQVAERLKSTVRESDAIARVGGDEFNIVLGGIARSEDMTATARKIIQSFREPFAISGHDLHVTTSIGISVYPDDSREIDTLFRYADIAMYHAKELGKNTYSFYNPVINMRSIERIKMENFLRRTLANRELVVHYQPQIDINTRKIVCAEALVRWMHPELGMLDSKRFIPAAEEIGFITTIDEWVLRTAAAQFKVWQDRGMQPLCLSVNISAREFQNPELVGSIMKTLDRTGLTPEYLEIEITESTAMGDIERSIARLNELTTRGIRISIDDFGTGYSSLSYLKRLPIQRLKIDQSFVRDISVDPDDRTIIKAVTAMAHSMKMKVVAEGVETSEQLDFLQSAHCDHAQGYFFNEPLPAERFSELIRRAART